MAVTPRTRRKFDERICTTTPLSNSIASADFALTMPANIGVDSTMPEMYENTIAA
jgi:hypothetical protein